MQDFLGRELHVGDSIVAIVSDRCSSELQLFTIKRLTKEFVVVDEDYFATPARVSPYKVIKVTTGE